MPGVLHERTFQGGRTAADETGLDGGERSGRLRAEAWEKLEWIADTYLSVSAPVQCAAARLLAAGEEVQRQIRRRTAENLAFARGALAGSAANILAVEGGWYITLQVPRVRSEEEWALELLEHADVLVQPGFFYDFEAEAFLVVSLLTETEMFREGTRAGGAAGWRKPLPDGRGSDWSARKRARQAEACPTTDYADFTFHPR